MALSADAPRTYTDVRLVESAQPVQASTTIYAGGALSRDSGGEVGPLAASEAFAGFARKKADNSSGSAGDVNAAVYDSGEIELVVTGVGDNDDIGDVVYATDDNTFTLTASGGVAIGRVAQIVNLSTGKCVVRFMADTTKYHTDLIA
jgi:hypothetical protein